MLFPLLLLIFLPYFECSDPNAVMTPCLQDCIQPIIKIKRSVANLYLYYDKTCTELENAAKCSKKCSIVDETKFYQMTTFYRVQCVDFEEELEDHLDCLKTYAVKADEVCQKRCVGKSDEMNEKEEAQKSICKSVECSTYCYYNEFSRHCPNAKELLMKMQLRYAHEMKMLTPVHDLENMPTICRNLHEVSFIKDLLNDRWKNDDF